MLNITDEMMENNKNEFIGILTEALKNRKAKTEELILKLESSDFFVAPASTRFHNCCKGGLVDHCLNVYYNMMSIARNKHLIAVHEQQPVVDEEGNPTGEMKDVIVEGEIEPDSIAIVALLHDIAKMNYYKLDYKNKKVYCESGTKKDANGRFDWVSIPMYITAPAEERFIYGSHEETSEYIARKFVSLTCEESSAILHHHSSLNFDSTKDMGLISDVYRRYTLATLLHIADTVSAFIDERY